MGDTLGDTLDTGDTPGDTWETKEKSGDKAGDTWEIHVGIHFADQPCHTEDGRCSHLARLGFESF